MAKAYFVTGTDTGVGKTLVSAALLHAFAYRGFSTVGMKPVVAGGVESRSGWFFEDVEALMSASTVAAPRALVNCYALREPIAPHIAAQHEGITIAPAAIEASLSQLRRMADVVIVEGVGGFRVPLGMGHDTADLARRLGLPVLLVVGLRLGCINHALLTRDAIDAAGLILAGWIANALSPGMPALEENVATLAERIDAPLLGRIPFQPSPNARTAAHSIDLAPLID